MIAKLKSFGLLGIEGYEVDVEVDVMGGSPSFEIVGLPDTAVKESKNRVKSAITNSGFPFPNARVTVNLAPADTKKEGTLYDLSVALCIMAATKQIDYNLLEGSIFLGELSLNGEMRHVNGLLPILIAARERGCKKVFVPKANMSECAYVSGVETYCVETLKEIVKFFKKEIDLPKVAHKDLVEQQRHQAYKEDFKYVMGQHRAKRAIEIAATGGHNILMVGPPGSGKTMLARCIPSIMPDMTSEECLEVTKIYSVAGLLDNNLGVVLTRPFRSPHHTATCIALTGGGLKAKPGEISLAHNGVLFLDELPEYKRDALEVLRQPLEDGKVTVARALRTVEYPARFILVAGMNPCPCGNFGQEEVMCSCSSAQIARYLRKISGPMLDRIDIHLEVGAVNYDELRVNDLAEPSVKIKERVNRARAIQRERFKDSKLSCNSDMGAQEVIDHCALDAESEMILKLAFEKLKLSARAFNRILKVARTIADLDSSEHINSNHISEAVSYRSLDTKFKSF